MKRLLVSILLGMSVNSIAEAETFFVSPNLCWGVEDQQEQGNLNPFNDSINVICPLPSWSSQASNGQANVQVSVEAATLIYTDLSSGEFVCHVFLEDWDGSLHRSAELHSCGTFGGCPDGSEDPKWQGQGQLNWANPLGAGTFYYPSNIGIACRTPGSHSLIRGLNFTITKGG